MTTQLIEQVALATLACTGGEDATPLREVQLAPDGVVCSKSGTFIVDEESERCAQRMHAEHGVDLPIDYEHQTLGGTYAAPDGKAPAAGWIKSIRRDAGRGLIAAVEWTEHATALIRAREYKYLSPVALVRKDDRKLVGIHSAGLTNKPAIPAMEALAAKDTDTEIKTMAEEPTGTGGDPGMLVAEIKALLGIEVENDTDVMAVLTAIRDWAKSNKGKGASETTAEGEDEAVASNEVLAALGVGADAKASEVIVKINSLKQGADNATKTQARLAAMEKQLAERAADDLMQPFITEHKINPNATEDMTVCREMAMSNPERFKKLMGERQPYVDPGKTTDPGGTGGAGKQSRDAIIAKAVKEYDEETSTHIASREAWVTGALKEAGVGPLTDDEKAKHIAV